MLLEVVEYENITAIIGTSKEMFKMCIEFYFIYIYILITYEIVYSFIYISPLGACGATCLPNVSELNRG